MLRFSPSMVFGLACVLALGCGGAVSDVAPPLSPSQVSGDGGLVPQTGEPAAGGTFEPGTLDAGSPGSADAGGSPDAGATTPSDGGQPSHPDAGCVKPTAANTGIPPGTALTVRSGGLTIKQDGAVVEAVEVKGSVTIAANNVTLRNSRIHGNIVVANGKKNAVIDHCNIGPDTGTFLDAIPELVQSHDFKLLHSDLHNFVAGVRADSNVYLYGNYLHDYYTGGNRSVSGVGGWGAYGPGDITLVCNNFDLADAAPGTPTREVNAVFEIICTDTSTPKQGLLIDHNWISGGGYAVYAWGFWSSMQVTNNVWDGTASYGPFDHNKDTPLTWSGNTYADGGVIKSPGVNSTGTNCHN